MGWQHKFFCEIDPFCLRILKYHFPEAEEYGDIRRSDFKKWRGQIDVLSVGFPCQPFSVAGKRNGAADDRYLWPEVYRAINEIRPSWILAENVIGILTMVLPGEETQVGGYSDIFGTNYVQTKTVEQYVIDKICHDLESIGYEIQLFIIPACSLGAPHKRDRLWIIANLVADNLLLRRNEILFKLQTQKSNGGKFDGSGPKQFFANPSQSGFQKWFSVEFEKVQEKNTPTIDNRSERFSFGKFVTNSNFEGLQRSSDDRKSTSQRTQQQDKQSERFLCTKWENFPTQSPVCQRNDGFSDRLSGITFSKWRSEAIKALGNSIVPQIAFEIFRAIEFADSSFSAFKSSK